VASLGLPGFVVVLRVLQQFCKRVFYCKTIGFCDGGFGFVLGYECILKWCVAKLCEFCVKCMVGCCKMVGCCGALGAGCFWFEFVGVVIVFCCTVLFLMLLVAGATQVGLDGLPGLPRGAVLCCCVIFPPGGRYYVRVM